MNDSRYGRSTWTSVRRRGGAALAAGVLLAAGLGTAPAFAAADGTVTVTDAALSWRVNTETGAGAYDGSCNYLSAGVAPDTGSSSKWTESLFASTSGNVSITKPDASGAQVPQTWAGRCLGADGKKVSAFGTTGTGNQVNISEGSGTVDPATDSGTITWAGGFTFSFYDGLTYWSVSDLALTLTNGAGTLTATASGYGADMDDPTVWTSLTPTRIDLATLQGVDVTESGLSVQPDFLGVKVTGSGVTQSTGANAGSFPQSLIDFTLQTGQAAYWYSSGGSADPRKVAAPLSIAYTATDTTPEPAGGDIDVTIPSGSTEQPATGEFGWAWSSEETVSLGSATQQGETFVASGALNEVLVTDTRAGGTGAYTWSLAGQAGAFASAAGESFTGAYLGWSPKVVTGDASVISAGSSVASSLKSGVGLATSQVLGSSTAAASATLGADLELVVPSTTKAGDYRSTLTITALS